MLPLKGEFTWPLTAYFTVSEDLLFYACLLPSPERKKLDAYLLLLEKSNARKYLKQINVETEPGRPKIDQCRPLPLFCVVLC